MAQPLTAKEQAELDSLSAQRPDHLNGLSDDDAMELSQLQAQRPQILYPPRINPTPQVPNSYLTDAAAGVMGLATGIPGVNQAAAAIRAYLPVPMPGGDSYQAELAKQTQSVADAKAVAPISFGAGKIAGQMGTAMATDQVPLPVAAGAAKVLMGAGAQGTAAAAQNAGDLSIDPSQRSPLTTGLVVGGLTAGLGALGSAVASKAATGEKPAVDAIADALNIDQKAVIDSSNSEYGTTPGLIRAAKNGLFDGVNGSAQPTHLVYNNANQFIKDTGSELNDVLADFAEKNPDKATLSISKQDILDTATKIKNGGTASGLSSNQLDDQWARMLDENGTLKQYYDPETGTLNVPIQVGQQLKQEAWLQSQNIGSKIAKGEATQARETMQYALGNELKDEIENTVGGDTVRELNKDQASAIMVSNATGNLLKDTSGNVASVNPSVLGSIDPLQAMRSPLQTASKMLQPAPSVSSGVDMLNASPIRRNTEAFAQFVSNHANLLGPGAMQMGQTYSQLPQPQQDKVGIMALQLAQQKGMNVEPSQTGYSTELNGRILDPDERNQAALQVFSMDSVPMMDRMKQISALNKDGTIPPSLIKNQVSPQTQAETGTASPQSAASPPADVQQAIRQAPTSFDEQVKVFKRSGR